LRQVGKLIHNSR